MLTLINFPVKIVKLFISNVSSGEIAAGVCLGMFFGLIPLNGPMALLLLILFFIFKINRLAAMLVIPFFKLLYVLGLVGLADILGGYLLIDAGYLTGFWRWFVSLPVIVYLDINNTLVAGGLALSIILCLPVYLVSKKYVTVLRTRYFDKIKNLKLVKWFIKLPLINKIASLSLRAGGSAS
ncbi:MAG: DUF2062 domain-containing protein [Candidatus Omnitrophota bacterium]